MTQRAENKDSPTLEEKRLTDELETRLALANAELRAISTIPEEK